jgi:hypothetical protein
MEVAPNQQASINFSMGKGIRIMSMNGGDEECI